MTSRRLWNWLSVLACTAVVYFSYHVYQQAKQDRRDQIQVYNDWMQLMTQADMYLTSVGHDEKPKDKNPHMYEPPNTALYMADKCFEQASSLELGASWLSHGSMSNVDVDLHMVALQLGQEVQSMYDPTSYANGEYQMTLPEKTLIAERDFLHQQLVKQALKGMPKTAIDIRDIERQDDHLKSLNLGVFSSDYVKFMVGIGQMKIDN